MSRQGCSASSTAQSCFSGLEPWWQHPVLGRGANTALTVAHTSQWVIKPRNLVCLLFCSCCGWYHAVQNFTEWNPKMLNKSSPSHEVDILKTYLTSWRFQVGDQSVEVKLRLCFVTQEFWGEAQNCPCVLPSWAIKQMIAQGRWSFLAGQGNTVLPVAKDFKKNASPWPESCVYRSQQCKTGQGEAMFPNSRKDSALKRIFWWTGNSVQQPNVTPSFLTIPAWNRHGTALTQTKPGSQVGRDGTNSSFLSWCFHFSWSCLWSCCCWNLP